MSTLLTGLAGFWDFDDDNANGRVGPNFTENGSITYEDASVKGRRVIIPAGSSNNLTIANANASALQIGTQSMTIAIRFMSTSLPVAFNSLLYFGSSPGYVITHNQTSEEFLCRFGDGTQSDQITTDATLAVNTIGTIICKFDRSEGIIRSLVGSTYKNRNIVNVAQSTDVQASVDFQIGTGFQNNGAFKIETFSIWNRALTDLEAEEWRDNVFSYSDLSSSLLGKKISLNLGMTL